MSGDRKRCQQLLLAYATKLTKATYFKKHICRQEDIENHIPFDKILQVYDSKTWTNKLDAIQKHLHERILSSALVDDIMIGEWRKRPTYPKRTAGFDHEPSRKGTETKDRIEVWRTYVNDELYISTWFMAPLAESIDWVKIRKTGTSNHRTLFHWVQACLVMAAETAFGLQRDELGPNNGKKMGGIRR